MGDNAETTAFPPPSWLDRDFAERALRVGTNDPTIEVRSVKVAAANAAGAGYISDMFRLTITLGNSEERRLVIKIQPQDEVRKEGAVKFNAFSIETLMFTEILPVMFGNLDRAKPGVYQPLAAKCFYHGDDPVPFIVLEDLRESGFTLTDKRVGMDLNHCSLAIRSLARFHAMSLAVHEQNPKLVEGFDKGAYSRDFFRPFMDSGLKCLQIMCSKWSGYEKYADKLEKLRVTFFDRLTDAIRQKPGEFNVLTHGDPWNYNMMFKYSGSTVEDIRFVDYQFSYYGSPALDVHYFMYTCPTEEVRIQHTEDLIRSYHEELVNISKILGISKPIISLQDLNKTLDDNVMYGFYTASVLLPINHSDPNDEEDRNPAYAEGPFEVPKMYRHPVYVSIIQRMLPIFEEKGVFTDF